jgi:GTP-binding protein HflX
MNTILEYSGSEKQVLAKDQLFATLDTANKKVTIDNKDFILVDTVGFVSKLPHGLVNSFFQTLEEIRYSDLIIVVLDASSQYIKTQYSVVMGVLEMLNVLDIPTVFLLNKWENTISESLDIIGKKTIRYSNYTKLNLNELITEILSEISASSFNARLLIPYSKGNLSNILEEKAIIYKKEFQATGTYFEVEIPSKIYYLFKDYDLDDLVS